MSYEKNEMFRFNVNGNLWRRIRHVMPSRWDAAALSLDICSIACHSQQRFHH